MVFDSNSRKKHDLVVASGMALTGSQYRLKTPKNMSEFVQKQNFQYSDFGA
jgi:hypothetical protein